MTEVWLVHTLNLDLEENDIKVFPSKSLAQVFAWTFYMQNFFCPEDVEEDWYSLIFDNEIYCKVDDKLTVKSIWITYHKIVESIEPKITFTINPNEKK